MQVGQSDWQRSSPYRDLMLGFTEACYRAEGAQTATLTLLCRPAVLVGVQPSVSNEEEMRAEWLVNTGLELPDEVPCYFDIRFSEDSDAPVVTVPSCCIWSSNGLIVQPATKKTSVGQSVLQSLAGLRKWMTVSW